MIQRNKGILTVVSGFSGSGKGTIMKELMRRYADRYALSISAKQEPQERANAMGLSISFAQKNSLSR